MEAIEHAVSSNGRTFVAVNYAIGIDGGDSWYIGEIVQGTIKLRFSAGSNEGGRDIAGQWLEDPDACEAHTDHKVQRRETFHARTSRPKATRRTRIVKKDEPVDVGSEAARAISSK